MVDERECEREPSYGRLAQSSELARARPRENQREGESARGPWKDAARKRGPEDLRFEAE